MATREERPTRFEFPTDPSLPERLPPDASVREVAPLRYYSCIPFYREHIERFVEQPLVEACRILFDKRVTTTLSSANREDLERGDRGALFVDYRRLSPTNQRIAEEVGRIKRFPEGAVCIIDIPIGPDSTVESISEYAVAVAEEFEAQEAPA